MRAPYPVTLTQVDDGSVVVQVGCKILVFENAEAAGSSLIGYFNNPEDTIKAFSARYGWNLNEPVAPAVGGAAFGYAANVASPRY